MASKIRIATLNVRGIKSKKKRLALYQWIRDNDIDVLLTQETYLSVNDNIMISNEWEGLCYHSFTNSCHCRGVATFISKTLKNKAGFNVSHIDTDNDGRRVIVTLTLDDRTYHITNVYCPNQLSLRETFLHNTTNYLINKKYNLEEVIIGGDFNCTNDVVDRMNSLHIGKTKAFDYLLNKLDAIDIWLRQHPGKNNLLTLTLVTDAITAE